MFENLAADAAGLRLGKITSKDDLLLCEAVMFENKRAGVELVLRRAQLSGRVEIDGTIEYHLADVLDEDGDIVQTIALDPSSYAILKNKWMPCKLQDRW